MVRDKCIDIFISVGEKELVFTTFILTIVNVANSTLLRWQDVLTPVVVMLRITFRLVTVMTQSISKGLALPLRKVYWFRIRIQDGCVRITFIGQESYEEAERLNESWLSNDHNVARFGQDEVCASSNYWQGAKTTTVFVFFQDSKEDALSQILRRYPQYKDAEVFI